jgi:CRISPR-associated endonuclease/helicase Cas3
MNDYYAHSTENPDKLVWQKLEDHLRGVAERAEEFAKAFKSENWAWNAGWLHDLGKATNAFQSYLLRSNDLDDTGYDSDGSTSNHASTGAAWAVEARGVLIGKILAYLAAGHHAGLPDWHSDKTGNAALPCRLEEGKKNLETMREFAESVATKLKDASRPPQFVRNQDFHLWIRMLFSCLVDADYLDTERFMDRKKFDARGRYSALAALAEPFWTSIKALERQAKSTSVNIIRKEIREACEQAATKDRGLFTLSVPTGGGKTLSAMAFAFRHNQNHLAHGFRRIIYVIPYTSIIEQTARILAGIFGRENVVEHHSNLSPEKETARSRMASENWDPHTGTVRQFI